jgi:hypothetical protein
MSGEASASHQPETKMFNLKLETLAFIPQDGASRRRKAGWAMEDENR